METSYSSHKDLLKLASDILGDLTDNHSTGQITPKMLGMIQKNIGGYNIKIFGKKINLIIRILRTPELYSKIDRDKLNVMIGIIDFLSDPEKYFAKINYKMLNPYDPTGASLKYEILKLGLVYVESELIETLCLIKHKRSVKLHSEKIDFGNID